MEQSSAPVVQTELVGAAIRACFASFLFIGIENSSAFAFNTPPRSRRSPAVSCICAVVPSGPKDNILVEVLALGLLFFFNKNKLAHAITTELV